MDITKTAQAIIAHIQKEPKDLAALQDLFDLCRGVEAEDKETAHRLNKRVRSTAAWNLQNGNPTTLVYELYRKGLLFDARDEFDAFLQYIEIDREPEKRFYLPRRHYLAPMVQGYQDILDGKLHLLTISMPKRAGKSQTELLFTLMLSGRRPDKATLMEGAGDALVTSFYKGCLEYLLPGNPYLFFDIFPEAKLVQTNADIKIINLEQPSRFPTIMCRSIDATQVGLSEASNALILDDCVEGREEAKNRQRLDDKWEVIRGDVIGRAIEGTPIVATGTRYSLYDPIGRLQEEAKNLNWTWRAIEIPALDPETDESNYEYIREGKPVFSTAFFREQREFLSAEQWESEFQQQPFEAKGLLFNKDSLNYYFELPVDKDPDTVFAVCDTAESGKDSCALPIAYIYGEDVFIEDVVFDNSAPEVTKPQCAKKLVEHTVSVATFESNNAGTYYARDVETLVQKLGGKTSIRTKRTISNKQTRIEMASDNIIKHFFFKHPSRYKRNSQYAQFMKEVTTYVRSGKVEHDDAPDSLSLLENELRGLALAKVEIFQRPW